MSLLGRTENVPSVLLQTAFAYLALLICARLLGKKQVGQLTFFHYVTGISLGSVAATTAVSRQVSIWEGLSALGLWTVLTWITSWVSMKSMNVRKVLEDEPSTLIRNGKIVESEMYRSQMTLEDLKAMLRAKGAFQLADVEFAVLETTGDLSVLKKTQQQPVTAHDLGIPTTYMGLATSLVSDGKILRRSLERLHLSEEWLMGELQRQGVEDVDQVVYAELDTQGRLYVDRHNRKAE